MDAGAVPFDRSRIGRILDSTGFDPANLSIRETNRLVTLIEQELNVRFVRMEFGVPNLPYDPIGVETAGRIEAERQASAQYPPFDGIPELKREASRFIANFLDLDIPPECCVPTVGSMQGGFIAQAIAGYRLPGRDTILYLHPTFPVSMRQTRFLGLGLDSIETADFRGPALLAEVERKLSGGRIGGLLYSSPNNPSWIALKEEELRGLGELCTRHDVLAIEDLAYLCMDFRQDYSIPGRPPFQPTIARYTDRYFVLISSSKIFSFAGARIGIAAFSPAFLKMSAPALVPRFGTANVGHAFVHGGVYCTTSGVPQSSQWGLVGLMRKANAGELDFVAATREYGRRAATLKAIFRRHGFRLVYDNDLGEPLADGFYFTFAYPGMSGQQLMLALLHYGLSAITLESTGSRRGEGLRACVSFVDAAQFPLVEERLACFRRDHPLPEEPAAARSARSGGGVQ
ncbi:MAG: pyridoxal phosphate-dependent aminotransferase [Candidatus Eisenbacteria bacterium]|uniref:Pyridoxal phosphate-dependent aminotransferase n=1 Tax=Eiseniibacteriota bacterium TaxID=2212470 RepID=A0A938BS73_UNCEI|nr:pyridoxal phosphate-dependent aminotransferase [Candidatus Eisenbacteria bacterium]